MDDGSGLETANSMGMSLASMATGLSVANSSVPRVATGKRDSMEKPREKRVARGQAGRNLEERRAAREEEMYGKKKRGEGDIVGAADSDAPGLFDDITEEQQDHMRAMLVNFCTPSSDRILNHIDLAKFGRDAGKVINNAVVQELCIVNPNITSLDMTGCDEVTDVALWAIARHLGNGIKHLMLGGCHQITNVGLRSLSLKCADVEHLDFTGCHRLNDLGLTTLSSGCWRLKKMILTNCTTISDAGLSRLAAACRELVELDLSGCTNVGEFGDKALKELGGSCNQIEVLNLMACKRVEDAGLIAVAQGCPKLKELKLSGCGGVSGNSLRAICTHATGMTSLKLSGSRLINDKDIRAFTTAEMRNTLVHLDLSETMQLGDAGVATIVAAMPHIGSLDIGGSAVTDASARTIVDGLRTLRALDLSKCGGGETITDTTVHTIAQGVSGLTKLRLDGCRKVSTRVLMSYIGTQLEFCEMSPTYVGYRPRDGCEDLIAQREQFRLDFVACVKIQCTMRRKKAYKIYKEKRRWWLINKVIPRAQAVYRGFKERQKWTVLQRFLLEDRTAVTIQTYFRMAYERWVRDRKLRELMFAAFREREAAKIQRVYWGMHGRRRVKLQRDIVANEKIIQARYIAHRELNANFIQRVWHAYKARVRITRLMEDREKSLDQLALEERCVRLIQRIAHGKLGRIKYRIREEEIELFELRFNSARTCQRVYRGHQGRAYAEAVRREKFRLLRNHCATEIQRVFRGGRGRILAAVTKALTELRERNQWYCREIQRVMRGVLSRMHLDEARKEKLRIERINRAAQKVQRILRGHKGREAADIERELQRMEGLAGPLLVLLKEQERMYDAQAKVVRQADFKDKLLEEQLHQVKKELMHVNVTNAKFTDCDKVTGTPQRFLTKYLRVRLNDHYLHEEEVFKVRRTELRREQKKEVEAKEQMEHTRRELVPLTTGLVARTKKERSTRLRKQVRDMRKAATLMQALLRRALVRVTFFEEDRDYWIECFDEAQSEDPYYFNTLSETTKWKPPRAYLLFCQKKKEEEELDLTAF
jgi:F-box/leucine-rich repeat protein 2/20